MTTSWYCLKFVDTDQFESSGKYHLNTFSSQRSANGYGEDSAVEGDMKTVAGQTFSEEDLKKERMSTSMSMSVY